LFVYGAGLVTLIFICFSFLAIRIKMRQYEESEFQRKLNRKLSLYLIAFVASQLPALVNRTQNLIFPENPVFVLYMLQALLQPAQGFFNAIVYGFNDQQFLENYRNIIEQSVLCHRCCVCFPCLKRFRMLTLTPGEAVEEIPIVDYDYHSEEEDKSGL